MSRWTAYRLSADASAPVAAMALAVACVVCVSGVLLAGPASAATGLTVKVTPDRGLANGQVVTVSGSGLTRTGAGSGLTWFVTECTAVVRGRMNPSTDTPYCDVTDAKAIKVSHNGSFSTKFRVRAGIVGDGYCGTLFHSSCVIGVGTARGQGTVVKITFTTPATVTTTTTTAP